MSRPTDAPLDPRRPAPLSTGDVHVWLIDLAAPPTAATLEGCDRVMSDDERRRLERFTHSRAQQTYRVARWLVRDVLSRYADVAPHEWQFVENRYGRPDVHPAHDCQGLTFNLSHTDGLVACAVTRGREIGVDVEAVDRRWSGVGLARRYFSPAEVDDLLALPEHEHREGFFAYWTLKEAYIKARGMGLAIPLDQFGFRLEADRPPTIAIDPRLADDARSWRFFQLRPSERHRLALAIRALASEALAVRVGSMPLPPG